jgi:branched-chain amino acid aminotransferase
VRLRPGAPARLFVLPAPAPPFGPDQLAEGVALRTDSRRRDERAPASRLKSDARDAARRARRDAAAAGADEALFLNTRGRVACGAGCNVFLLTADGLATPPVEEGALPGIARAALFVAARRLGVPLREAPISVAELAAAPDLLLTASALGLVAVRSLDGRPLQRPVRGSLRKGLVPRLRLALHELCELPALPR